MAEGDPELWEAKLGLAWPGLESIRARLLLAGLEAGAGSLVVEAGAAAAAPDSLTLEFCTSEALAVAEADAAGGVDPDVDVGAARADQSEG